MSSSGDVGEGPISLQGGASEAMARLEFFEKWRAIASLDPALRFSQIQ